MTDMFSVYIERILESEGGLSMQPEDPGNWTGGSVGVGELKGTNWGISAASFPNVDIKNLTRTDAISIYRTKFWVHVHGETLPGAVAFSALDGAVNSGISRSIMWLQQAAGVADDGLWGPITAAAIARADPNDLLLAYNSYRLSFMTRLSTWDTFGKGWARRISKNLLFGMQDN